MAGKPKYKDKDTTKQSYYHGLYVSWHDMKRRCYSKTSMGYKYWGGRGIKICDEWLTDYNNFKEWAIKHGWQKGMTIDRIDSDKNYCPENCRWILQKQQSLNLRNTNLYKCGDQIFSQRHIIEFLWTLKVGEVACIEKLKVNSIKVGNPYHKNHRNHYSK